MTTKGEGKVWDNVAAELHARGIDTSTLKIATLWRGSDHLVILNDEVEGEYNHRSRKLLLYSEFIKEQLEKG